MDREKLAAELIRDEGLRLEPYVDTVGKLTIGVGRNLADRGISKAEAEFLLETDIGLVEDVLDTWLSWWRTLSEVRQRVLANMCFNMGIAKLRGFKNTLAAMKTGDYEAAAAGMRRSLWARQVGARAERLAKMMKTGEEPGFWLG